MKKRIPQDRPQYYLDISDKFLVGCGKYYEHVLPIGIRKMIFTQLGHLIGSGPLTVQVNSYIKSNFPKCSKFVNSY